MKEGCKARATALLVVIAAMFFALLPATTQAGPIPPGKEIDFRGGEGGSFTYMIGVGSHATVNDAPIASAISFPTFRVVDIEDGLLDLTTGPCIMTCLEGNAHGFPSSVPQFDKGGSLVLMGGIPSLGIPDGTVLLNGTFVPFTDAT